MGNMLEVWYTQELVFVPCIEHHGLLTACFWPTLSWSCDPLQLPTTPTWDDFRLLSRHLRAESSSSIVITDEDGTPVEVRRPRARSLRSVSVCSSVCPFVCPFLCSSSVCLSAPSSVCVSRLHVVHLIASSHCLGLDMMRCVRTHTCIHVGLRWELNGVWNFSSSCSFSGYLTVHIQHSNATW